MLISKQIQELKDDILNLRDYTLIDWGDSVRSFLYCKYLVSASLKDITLHNSQVKYNDLLDYTHHVLAQFNKVSFTSNTKDLLRGLKLLSTEYGHHKAPLKIEDWYLFFEAIEKVLNQNHFNEEISLDIYKSAISLSILELDLIKDTDCRKERVHSSLSSLIQLASMSDVASKCVTFLNISEEIPLRKIPVLDFRKLKNKYDLIAANVLESKELPLKFLDASYAAAEREDAKCVSELISKIIYFDDINTRDPHYGNDLLQWACMNEDFELAKLAIHTGIDVNATHSGGVSSLYRSLSFKSNEITKMMLDRHAIPDSSFITHLHSLAKNNDAYAELEHTYFPNMEELFDFYSIAGGFKLSI